MQQLLATIVDGYRRHVAARLLVYVCCTALSEARACTAGCGPRATELDAHVHWYSLKLAWRMAAPERRHISVRILVIILVFQILLKKVAYK